MAQTIPVPSQYQDLYSLLNTQISGFNTAVQAGWNGQPYPVIYSPQLEAASSVEYQALLQPYIYSNAVLPELEELRALGAKAVTVQISFPILYQPFYTSNPAQYQQFVSFYQQLAQDVRARGMKLIVETTYMAPFSGTGYAACEAYYQGLSWTDYVNGRAQNAANIAQLIQPDYLSVVTEPDNEALFTGQTNAGTVSGSTQIAQAAMTMIEQAGPTQTQVGAGAGTWTADFPDFVSGFAATDVQYVDMHIYPINNGFFLNMLSGADIAHAAGKQVAISEAWEQKVRNSELLTMSGSQIFARDPFSFWEPVDIAFQQALVAGAQYKQFAFISPAWVQYFFATLDFNTYGTFSSSQITADEYEASGDSVQIGSFTPTGLAWEATTVPGTDTTAPAVPAAPFAGSVLNTTVVLNWVIDADNIGVAAYNLYRNGTLILTTSLFQYMDYALTPGATYAYTISAFDASGNTSAQSPALTVQTVDTTPPGAPQNLTVTGVTVTSVNLTWSASTGIEGVAGYRILKGSSPTSLKPVNSTAGLSYTDTHAKPATTYYYAVEGYLANKIASSPSNVVTATTLAPQF